MCMRILLRLPVAVWIMIVIYCAFFITVSVVQYLHFGYTGQDLAIFDQVLWNTSHGRWFAYSYNNYSYLVDHREWMLAVLASLYWIVPHPITILVLQTLVIASGAIPLFLLARNILHDMHPRWSIAASLVYLVNPTLQQMNLYEFHMYPFVIPLVLWWWLAVVRGKLGAAVLLFLLILLVRDDASVVMFGAGLLLLFFPQKNFPPRRQRILGATIIIMSVVWLIGMGAFGEHLSPYATPKYFAYYDWAGSTTREVIQTIITQPGKTIHTMFFDDHVPTMVLVFANVGFLALAGGQYLLPLLGPLLLYLLTDAKLASSLLTMHHGASFLPWLFIASLYGFRNIAQKIHMHAYRPGQLPLDTLFFAAIIGTLIFQSFLLGPWPMLHKIFFLQNIVNPAQLRTIMRDIPPNAAVLSTSRFYPFLAHREKIYPLQHLWFGKEHLMTTPYIPPEQVDWLLIEQDELLSYLGVLTNDVTSGIPGRLGSVIAQNNLVLTQETEDVFVYTPATTSPTSIAPPILASGEPLEHTMRVPVTPPFELLGWEINGNQLRMQLQRTQEKKDDEKEIHMQLTWFDATGKQIKYRRFLIGAGLEPTTTWNVLEPKIITQTIAMPPNAHRLDATWSDMIIQNTSKIIGVFATVLNPEHAVTMTLATSLGETATAAEPEK